LPGKLADCSTKDATVSELYIVEGDSAGGCWDGDTKIALADGRNLSFKELVKEEEQGKNNYCYTIKDDGDIGIEKILNPRITKKNAEVIKIILDNAEELICTPDHKFMMRNGSYIEAQNLKPEISLMPLVRKLSKIEGRITIKGYEMVLNPQNHKWIFTHLLSDKYNLEKKIYNLDDGEHKHHKNFNKLNNNPDNIVRMPKEENKKIQAEKVKNFFKQHPEQKELLTNLARQEWTNKELLQWRSQKTKEQWTAEFREKRKLAYTQTYLNHSLSFAKKMQENGQDIFATYERERANLPKRNNNLLKLDTLLNRFFNGNRNALQEAVVNFNHKIKRIEKISKKIDVYDIEIPKTHNFALASGIFVHNSAKQGRNRENQAILPLRGKILNIERARIDKILTNNELKSLIIAMGTNIGEMFDISKLRYHRIVIMTDADVDGAHIRTLLLTLFFRHFPQLITNGHIFIAQPPLFKVQSGKEFRYAFSDEERDKIVAEFTKNKEAKIKIVAKKKEEAEETEGTEESPEGESSATIGGIKINIQRYKGLGEMNPDQLWETTMDPTTRTMRKITIEDAEKADEIFDILMGDEVEPRRKFIQTHAKSVKELDI